MRALLITLGYVTAPLGLVALISAEMGQKAAGVVLLVLGVALLVVGYTRRRPRRGWRPHRRR